MQSPIDTSVPEEKEDDLEEAPEEAIKKAEV